MTIFLHIYKLFQKNGPMNGISLKNAGNEKSGMICIVVKYSYLLIIIIPLLIFAPFIKNGFVYFDDDILILENQSKITDPGNLLKTFRSDAFFNNSSPFYRPLLNVSFMVDAQIGGTNPGIYHFTNILLHILTALSLLVLLQLLGFSYNKSLAGALVFSVHPLMANAVFWIPARNDLLVTLFSLLFFIYVIKFVKERKVSALILTAVFFFLALFSKESAIILPILVVLYLFITKQYHPDKQKLILLIVLLVIVAGWYLLRITAIDMRSDTQRGFSVLFKSIPFAFEIIAKFFLPFNYAATPVFTWVLTSLGILFTLITCILIIRFGKSNMALIIFGAAWFILFCLPNMYVRLVSAPDSYEYLAHRGYLPIAGLLIVLLALIPDLKSGFNRKFGMVVFSLMIIIFSAFSFDTGNKYRSPVAFWKSAIEYNPNRAWFYHFLGRYYFKQGDYIMFEKYIREAIALKEYPRFLYNLGMLYFTEKKGYDTAFRYLTRAHELGFHNPEATRNYVNLCIISANDFFRNHAYHKAAQCCEIAVSLDPVNSVAVYNLGLYYVYQGENKKAAAMWRRSLTIKPVPVEAYRSLYLYYLNNTDNRDSVNYFAHEFQIRGGIINPPVPKP